MRLGLVALFLSVNAWAREPAALPSGSLERQVITDAVNQKLQDVQRCAEASLVQKPGTVPKVVVRFTIGIDGKVGDARIEGPPPTDAKYGECLLQVVRSLTPKKKPQGGAVTVTYPFTVCGVGY